MPRALFVALATLLPGCAIWFLEPPKHERRAEEAAALASSRCAPEDASQADPKLFAASAVESVEPLYNYTLGSASGREAHLRGARLHLRPPKGASAEWLQRAFECHDARLVLGTTAPSSKNEPYWLEDGWVELEVRSDGAGFVVDLAAEDVERAGRLLAKAQAFAKEAAR
jgi:hypothetical protein